MLEKYTELVGETDKFPYLVGVNTETNMGTGVLIGPQYVLTCEHVVRGADEIEVVSANGVTQARSQKLDDNVDLALLRLAKPISASVIRFTDSPLKQGARLRAVGVQEKPGSPSQLTVAEIPVEYDRKSDASGIVLHIQVEGGALPGYSGGPIILTRWGASFCIGVTNLGRYSTSSFAIGMGHIRAFVPKEIPLGIQKVPSYKVLTAAILFLLAANWLFGFSDFGDNIEVQVYKFLQYGHSSFSAGETLPVVVLDISGMRQSRSEDDQEEVTSRDGLEQIINSMFPPDSNLWPRGIAIDVDFSPGEDGPITEQDRRFFQFCQKISSETGVPIFLGTYGSIHNNKYVPAPSMWLGGEGFIGMAADISIPVNGQNAKGKKSNPWMLGWIQTNESDQLGMRLLSLSSALADSYKKNNHAYKDPTPFGAHWALTPIRQRPLAPGVSAGEFLVDYSPLQALEEEAVSAPISQVAARSLQSVPWQRKVVLIGYGKSGNDAFFAVPGLTNPVAGVYVHACASYTQIRNPIFFWTAGGRLVVDLALLALAFGCLIQTWSLLYAPPVSAAPRRILMLLPGLLVVAGGATVVRVMHIAWDDFFIVGAVLLVSSCWSETGRSWRKVGDGS